MEITDEKLATTTVGLIGMATENHFAKYGKQIGNYYLHQESTKLQIANYPDEKFKNSQVSWMSCIK